ncbi:MAG: hypothetical protein JSV65_17275 [Armatimonadota bacterium]|nr:MAG: hypothetical protein JSV65_17275 [Armatimonadota bacterium]
MDASITYFEETGPANTAAVLALVKKRAAESGIKHVVIASTTGATAAQAAAAFADTEVKLVIVPHQWRWREERQFDRSLVPELERAGHHVYWSTMLFHTEELYGNSAGAALANILRTFGQGMKVCLEILLMATNGGQIDIGEKVIVAAGSGRGADTAVLATAATSNRLKEVRIHEILCKPLLE